MPQVKLDDYNFVFHIGYPKCGSTFLQKRILNQHTNFESMTPISLELMVTAFNHDFNAERFQNTLLRSIQNPADKNVIISHELFMLPRLDDSELLERFKKHIALFNWTIPEKPDAEKPYYNVKAATPNCKVILILRNQFDIIMSEYVHRVREDVKPWRDLKQIDRFFEETYQSKLYHKTIELVFGIFGKENVLVMPFEWIKTDSEKFIRQIEAFTGTSYTRVNLAAENQGEYQLAKLMSRKYASRIANIKNTPFFINQRISNFLYYRFISKPFFITGIKKINALYYGNAAIKLPPRIYERYKEEFSKSNQATSNLTSLDLKACGYE